MVPSPRKRASRQTFDQTWDVTDAAFLDPNALPVARIPRGWERKQEIKRTEEGKEKKIWRRFNLRSRASTGAEEEQEEEHDARSRPVKKLQQMSPKAMERATSRRNGKNRAFKATRWDRRKSVLPRKKVVANTESIDSLQDALEQEDEDETFESNDTSDTSIDEQQNQNHLLAHDLLPKDADRRSTFTFTMDAPSVEQPSKAFDGGERHEDFLDTIIMEDATITRLFKTPIKQQARIISPASDPVEYPQLPDSESEEAEHDAYVHDAPAQENEEESRCADVELIDALDPEPVAGDAYSFQNIHDEKVDDVEAMDPEPSLSAELLPIESPATPVVPTEIHYPILQVDSSPNRSDDNHAEDVQREELQSPQEDVEMSEIELDISARKETDNTVGPNNAANKTIDASANEELIETSLQLDIQKDYESALEDAQPASSEIHDVQVVDEAPEPEQTVAPRVDDITDGLTLSFTPAKPVSAEPTPKKFHSPPPPLRPAGADDVTMTIALDDDTALLKDFLTRAAASKAEKAAVLTHRRESLQNRRDSDVVRHALASPRKALGERDPNSPSKCDNEVTLDLSQTLNLDMDQDVMMEQAAVEGSTGETSGRTSRRSSRTKKSRLPAPASAAQAQAQASKIAIRRVDGNEHVVLKKTDAQELATLTRANTRKNKQGAFVVTLRLLKLTAEAATLPPVDDSTREIVVGKNVRWDETLAYYQEDPETVAERESLETPDELSMPSPSTAKKTKVSKNSTPKIRRVRGLGTANGTPGKGLLAPASLLPEAVQEEKEAAQASVSSQQISRPKSSKIKKMPVASTTDLAPTTTPSETRLPALEIAPVGVEPTKERKSRLAAPKKVTLPQPAASLPADGKENTQRTGISAGTPKKGIPAPKVLVPPTVGMESGLPRRRARKL